MAGRDELLELREEARRARANATAKAGRLRRQGVVISGSSSDPRRAAGVEKSYNSRQLRSYVNSMKEFNKRSTKFVAGAEGRPITLATANRLKSASIINNIKAMNRLEVVGKLTMPGTNRTFDEMRKIPKQRRGPIANMTYELVHVDPKQIMGEGAAKKLASTMEKRATASGRRTMNASGNKNVNKMLDESNNQFIRARWNSLTSDQRELLMNTPSFWESVKFSAYPTTGGDDDGEHESDVMSLINWAEKSRPSGIE